jgi:hypothetical protein
MTCYAAEDGAQQTSFGSDLATSKAKTQAGYAIVAKIIKLKEREKKERSNEAEVKLADRSRNHFIRYSFALEPR